jgi:uncharacterized protein YkwD
VIQAVNTTRLAEYKSTETYAPQGVLSGRAARRCLAVAGVTVAAMISFTESTSKAQAQSANVYTCPGAKVAFKDQPQQQFDAAVECIINAERAERGRSVLPHSNILAKAAIWHSQDMTDRNYFSDIAPDPSPHGTMQSDRIQKAAIELTGSPLIAPDIGRPYSDGTTIQDIVGNDKFSSPNNVVGAYMNSGGHCNNLMEMLSTSMGSGTSNDKKNSDGTNTILFTLSHSGPREWPKTCKMIASIDDPLYKPNTSQRLKTNLKLKKISTKKGKRLQVNIDVDDLNAPGVDKKHDAPIEKGTAVSLQIKRKVGKTAFKTVLKKTFKVNEKGRARTSIAVPKKSKWEAIINYKIPTAKRWTWAAYTASTKPTIYASKN